LTRPVCSNLPHRDMDSSPAAEKRNQIKFCSRKSGRDGALRRPRRRAKRQATEPNHARRTTHHIRPPAGPQVGTARCAVPVAERKRQATEPIHARRTTPHLRPPAGPQVGTARCAVPVAERSARRRNRSTPDGRPHHIPAHPAESGATERPQPFMWSST
jgi:hypothetical protein